MFDQEIECWWCLEFCHCQQLHRVLDLHLDRNFSFTCCLYVHAQMRLWQVLHKQKPVLNGYTTAHEWEGLAYQFSDEPYHYAWNKHYDFALLKSSHYIIRLLSLCQKIHNIITPTLNSMPWGSWGIVHEREACGLTGMQQYLRQLGNANLNIFVTQFRISVMW